MTCNPMAWPNSRVLVLEDEPLLLLDVQDMLSEMGVATVTACATIEAAARAVDGQHFELALLDVMVGTQTAIGLALDLQQRGTSIGFVSGTEADFLAQSLKSCPLLRKPYTSAEFKTFLGLLTR